MTGYAMQAYRMCGCDWSGCTASRTSFPGSGTRNDDNTKSAKEWWVVESDRQSQPNFHEEGLLQAAIRSLERDILADPTHLSSLASGSIW
jgi:hypothetical protein